MTSDQWIKILKYVAIVNEKGHVDIEYVFRFLLHSNAFEFSSEQEFVSVTVSFHVCMSITQRLLLNKQENFYNLKAVKGHKKATKTQEKETKKETDEQIEHFKSLVFHDELLEVIYSIEIRNRAKITA